MEFGHRLDRVAHEVQENLLDLDPVHAGVPRLGTRPHLQFDRSSRAEQRQRGSLANDLLQI